MERFKIGRCPKCGTQIKSDFYDQNPDPTTEERLMIEAEYAEASLNVYSKLYKESQNVTQENVANLMTALLHLCNREDIDTDATVKETLENFALDRR